MASARDVIVIGAILFIVGMSFLVINFSTRLMMTELVQIPAINQTPEAVDALNATSTTVDRLDYVIFGLFLGLTFAVIITGWFVGGEPVFMFMYFLAIVVGVIFSMILSNTWEEIAGASIWGNTLAGYSVTETFPILNNLMTYLPIYVTIIGALAVIVMFSRPFVTRQV